MDPPPRPNAGAIMGRSPAAALTASRAAAGFVRRPRHDLPARLTPDTVRDMLSRVRVEVRPSRCCSPRHIKMPSHSKNNISTCVSIG